MTKITCCQCKHCKRTDVCVCCGGYYYSNWCTKKEDYVDGDWSCEQAEEREE